MLIIRPLVWSTVVWPRQRHKRLGWERQGRIIHVRCGCCEQVPEPARLGSHMQSTSGSMQHQIIHDCFDTLINLYVCTMFWKLGKDKSSESRGRTDFWGDAYTVCKWKRNLHTKISTLIPTQTRLALPVYSCPSMMIDTKKYFQGLLLPWVIVLTGRIFSLAFRASDSTGAMLIGFMTKMIMECLQWRHVSFSTGR